MAVLCKHLCAASGMGALGATAMPPLQFTGHVRLRPNAEARLIGTSQEREAEKPTRSSDRPRADNS